MSRQSMAGRWDSGNTITANVLHANGKTQSASVMHAMQGDLQLYTISVPQSCETTTQVQLAVSSSHLKVSVTLKPAPS